MKRLPALSLLLALAATLPAVVAPAKPNILMIAVDDLRPQLASYGVENVVSPHIDRLAAAGVVFDRAYCMVPTCGASRASLMTSIRPSPKRFVTHLASAEEEAPGIPTLNTWFKRHGYTTISNGKVFHHAGDSAAGWSEPVWRPSVRESSTPVPEGARRGPPYEISPRDDAGLPDGKVAQKTIDDLRRLAEAGKPFFLAAGFYKPHLPFIAPKRYWDLYPPGSLGPPRDYHRPEGAPDAAIHNSGELRHYAGVPKTGPVSDEMALELIRGYHACVSFTDAQIGRVLDELDRLGLAENTIVILWGDHGWNLGEHTLWNKHSCFETSMRVPLLVRGPGIASGVRTAGLTELIDVYPTLCELAGLPVPPHAEGRSFVPLLEDPSQPWKEEAIGRFGRGDTIRTDTHRFTEYAPAPQDPATRMLYDHRVDPRENVNISERAANAAVVEELAARLRAGKGNDDDLERLEARK